MIGRITRMRLGKCLLSGILTAAILCSSLLGVTPAGMLDVSAAESNVALNKPVTTSGIEPNTTGCTGDKAVDGINDENSRWAGGYMKVLEPRGDQWITIDLKAAATEVTSISVAFHLKVWATKYRIETSDSSDVNGTWETVKSIDRPASDENSVTDVFAASDLTSTSLKRYVRLYFTELNEKAGGHAISIREIEIMGTQTGVINEVSSVSEALGQVPGSITVDKDTDVLPLPSFSNYDIKVYGSEVDRLVSESETANGAVSPYRIGDRTFNVIVKATNKNNPSDTAKKNVTVTVKDNTADYPDLFPTVKNPNPMPDVLPTIQEWYGYEGAFALKDYTKIIVNDQANIGLMEVAKEMQDDIKEICGFTLRIQQGTKSSADDIYLASLTEDTYGTGEEGYFLINGENGIEIYSTTKTGVLYGTVTVEQILYQDVMHAIVPKGVIRDYPLYALRGMMFDVARITTRMQFLEDYTKILKWYKMNDMQLHLNDTQWSEPNRNSEVPEVYDKVEASHRLESELFPSLAKQDAKFEVTNGLWNNKYGGDYEGRYDYYYSTHTGTGEELYYTKDEYRNLEKLADRRGIKLVAELDTPGHATPYNKYVYNHQEEVIHSLVKYGYISADEYLNEDGTVKKNFYTHNPNNFEVFAIDDENSDNDIRQNAIHARIFMKALFDEYLGGVDGIEPVFTADTVHAGVDEYFDTSEYNKAAFRRYMNEMYDCLGESKDGYQKEVRMWGGLQLMGGSEGVNRDIVLYMWNCRTEENLNARLSDGFHMVNIPQLYFYTTPGRYHKDMVRENYIYYNWEPEIFDGGGRVDKGEPLLQGVEAALWGDANRSGTTEADLNERYLRSIAMVSEKSWGGTKADDTFLSYEQTFDRLKEGPGTNIANDIDSKTNIVLDYDFENISSDGKTIYDASGNGYNGTITGGQIVTQGAEKMLKFDGNTKIETPLTSLGYPYTMSFDLYLDGTESNNKDSALFSGYDGRLQVKGLNDQLGLNRNHFTQSFGYPVETGKHRISIVGTYQATKLYVDGEFKKILYAEKRDPNNGGTLGNENWTDKDNNFATTFVFPLNVIGENFSGCLGNIRAYNKALSTEEFAVEEAQQATEADVARNRFAYADIGNSSYLGDEMRLYPAWKATDGDGHVTGAEGTSVSYESRWYSSDRNDDFLMIDLGQERKISKVVIDWEANRYAASYNIEVSPDGKNWTKVKETTGNTSALTTDTFDETTARYVKMQGVQRKSGASEYAIYEMKVYGSVDKTTLAARCQAAEASSAFTNVDWETTGAKKYLYESLVLAKAVCADVMAGQEEVDAAMTELENAISKWESGITETLSEYDALMEDKSSQYTASSWKAFTEAYQAVANATAAELPALKQALEAAKNALVELPTQSKIDEMAEKLAAAEALLALEDEYETNSWNKFMTAYIAARDVKEVSAAEYDTLLSNLTKAMGSLEKKSTTKEPQQLAAPAVTAVKSQKTNVSITWNAVANASGYQLYRKTGSSVVKVGGVVTGTIAYDEDPLGDTDMSYYVVALAGGKAGYKDSAAGAAKSIKLPKETKKLTASQVKGKKAVNLKWKKVKNATSYLIYRAEGNGAYKQVGQVKKKVAYQDKKKLKKGKTYSYKVVAVVKKQYSPMKAAKKAVKIK